MSVQVGSDPTTAPRYYYVYDARGDVVNLTDVSGNVVASYAYDTWGQLTSASEDIPNAGSWTNPYRFDGRDGVQSDPAIGLDWLATRAYDPTTGRFLSQDPLRRTPLFFADNPYVYAGNDPVSNIDPSGQYRAAGFGSAQRESGQATNQQMARIQAVSGCDKACQTTRQQEMVAGRIAQAKGIAGQAEAYFAGQVTLFGLGKVDLKALTGSGLITVGLKALDDWLNSHLLENLSLLTVGWAIENMAVATYDLIAFAAQLVFQYQTLQLATYWLTPTDLSGTWGVFGLTTALLGTLLSGLSLVFMATMPDFSPVWAALAIGLDVAIFKLLPRFKAYIDQEEQALGYPQT